MMDRAVWDERYGGEELVWSSTPNQFLVSETEGLAPGRAVDLACGEGRNAIWLAEQGWHVAGVDFSPVGLAKAGRLAEARGVEVEWVEASVLDWDPPVRGFDLVAVFYLQLPQPERDQALRIAASAVAPAGTLLVVAHDLDNLTKGHGGPQTEAVLYRVDDVVRVAEASGLVVQRAEQVLRTIEHGGERHEAIDTLVRASRPA